MYDALRALLLLALAGALITAAGSGAAWWLDEERRLRRFLRRALGAAPEVVILAPGAGRGAGFSLDKATVAILWDGGVRGLIYRLPQFLAAELIIDDQVAGRASRDEARRPLDQAPVTAQRVAVRLIFDNPNDPDFELELWPPADPAKRERGTAGEAIATSRRWLSGVDAILRRSPSVGALADDELESVEDDDDAPPWGEDDVT